ncbi:MAG: GNAT family N-acetyltransferase [Paracoccaceae bacterium]
MKIRAMCPNDVSAALSFYEVFIQISMFPLINLRDNGLTSQHADPPARSVEGWIAEDQSGIRGLIIVTHEGAVMPVLPDGDFGLWAAVGKSVRNRALLGILGEACQVRAGLRALELQDAPTRMNEDDAQYSLTQRQFQPVECHGKRLKPFKEMSRDLLVTWRAAYASEVLGLTNSDEAGPEVDAYTKRDSHRVLMDGDEPLAMTGFNATTPDCVQVGGVFTPRSNRGRGYASQALTLHLKEAFTAGVSQVTLFAASANAARIYERLGFEYIGEYALVLFQTPHEVKS